MSLILQSEKLRHVCYEIRGPALQEAKRLEEEGHRITKLNIEKTLLRMFLYLYEKP